MRRLLGLLREAERRDRERRRAARVGLDEEVSPRVDQLAFAAQPSQRHGERGVRSESRHDRILDPVHARMLPLGRSGRLAGTATGDTARVRIAIDARPASDAEPTGVGHYTRRMLEHLPGRDALRRARGLASAGRGLRPPALAEPDRDRVADPRRPRTRVAPPRGPEARGPGAVRRAARDELPPAADPQRRRRARRARPGVRGDARGGSGVRRAVAAPVRRLAASERRGDRALVEREGRPARAPPARREPTCT